MTRMNINIRNRFCPFSHSPGTRVLIPGTKVIAEVFPKKLRLYDFENTRLLEEIDWKEMGFKDFTVIQDLEKGRIKVCGGGLHYDIIPTPLGFDIMIKGKRKQVPFSQTVFPVPENRLFFGVHKKQEWQGIWQRADFQEFAPFWHRLGQMLPKEKSEIEDFQKLFSVGFEDLFFPKQQDDRFLGIDVPKVPPLTLLSSGSDCIQKLFIKEKEGSVDFLPHLPKECIFGRGVDFKTSFGKVSFSWKGRCLHKVFAHVEQKGSLHFPAKRFRLRRRLNEKGERIFASFASLEEGFYFLDRFER